MNCPCLPAAILLLTGFFPNLAAAATYNWDGSNSGLWITAANWNTAPVQPLTDDTLVFPASGANRLMTQNLNGSQTVYRLFFNDSGYTLTGNSLGLGAVSGSPLIQLNHTSGTTVISVNLLLTQNSGCSVLGGGTLAFAPNGGAGGSIDLDSYTLTLDSAGATEIGAIISGSGRVIHSGSGVVRMAVGYDQVYAGTTTVSGAGGTLIVNGSLGGSILTCGSLSNLAGSGSISAVSTLNGTVSPGDGGKGRLVFTRGLSLTSSARLVMELGQATNGGTTYDQLRCQGTVAVGGMLSLGTATGFNPALGEVFTLINKTSAGAITGTFNGLPEGAQTTVGGRVFTISYVGGTGNDLTLAYTGAAPAITSIADQTLPEDTSSAAIRYTLSDADTPVAGLTISIQSDNPALLDPATNLDPIGTTEAVRGFYLTPPPDRNGTARIVVAVSDGMNTTRTSFLLTVTPVNDPPSFTPGPDQVTGPEPGVRTVAGWATNLSAGPPDEADQTLSFKTVENSNLSLFSELPVVSPTGTLTYTPAPGLSGTAYVAVQLLDSGGGNPSLKSFFSIKVNGSLPLPDPRVINFSAVPRPAGGRSISMTVSAGPGAANRLMQLQTSGNLTSWNTVTVAIANGEGTASFNYDDVEAGATRYYRSRLP